MTTDTLPKVLNEIDRRLTLLENTNPLLNSSIFDGKLSVTDTNGVLRAEMGHLAANGISPAQYGFRASDATGTPIFDSLGLIGVMQRLGNGDMVPQNQNFSTANGTTFTDTGCNVSVTLPRTQFLLVVWWAPAKITAGTFYAYLGSYAFQGATNLGAVDGGVLFDSGIAGYVNVMAFATIGLVAGTYTFKIRVATDAGVTLAIRNIHCDVYLAGG